MIPTHTMYLLMTRERRDIRFHYFNKLAESNISGSCVYFGDEYNTIKKLPTNILRVCIIKKNNNDTSTKMKIMRYYELNYDHGQI